MYASYEYYNSEYMGAPMSEEEYSRAAKKAGQYLDYYTMGRAKDSKGLEALSMACCALAEQYFEIDTLLNKARESAQNEIITKKKSETVGSYSVTYQSAEEVSKAAYERAEELKKKLPEIVKLYLSGTGLLYRGGGCGVCASYRNGI